MQLKWLTGTATIRYWQNQAVCEQTDTGTDQTAGDLSPCHFYPKCHKICSPSKQTESEIIDAFQRSNEDLTKCFNITEDLTQYQQMYIYVCTILAYLRDSLTYMRQVAIHTMEYGDATTTNILSPDILPVKDLRNML